MSAHATHRTQYRTAIDRETVAKSLPAFLPTGDEFFVASVLSLPVPDLAGDIVHADRFTFDAHRRNPYVDFEHGRDPAVGSRPVGWARDTYAQPGGTYALFKCRLNVPGIGVRDLRVGGTYFDRDDPLQRQVCFGVRDGQWPGVSLEFVPDWSVAKSLGRSPLEHRDAREFTRGDVVRWTHCVEPVCPGAASVLKSLPPELDALARTLRDGTIRGERLHPVIRKSLARYAPTTKLIAVGKSMNPMDAPQTAYDPAIPDEAQQQPDENAPPLNGVTAIYSHVEALLAAAQQLEQDMQSSDSPELRQFAGAFKGEIEALANKAKSVADHHDAKLNGYMPLADSTPLADAPGGDAPPVEGDDLDTDDTDDTDAPDLDDADDTDADEGDDDDADEKPKKKAPPFKKALSTARLDADGALLGVRAVYPPILKARRAAPQYTLDEITKGIAAANRQRPAAEVEQPEDPALAKARQRAERKVARLERLKAIHS